MQNALTSVKHYCDTWKVTVNVKKTKIVIFSRVICFRVEGLQMASGLSLIFVAMAWYPQVLKLKVIELITLLGFLIFII
ncbi:hypothetical protein HOLleu_08844 [Holothuria leucospilota]|uniref:Uncharacterized protein n=1 Tax=Holothuria leucospilota TaxID=206669 RepID=A0A9Q1HI46_HOLLE|nr:hypothetical protein HOLleu_08844 [Holothuria leucospilota]